MKMKASEKHKNASGLLADMEPGEKGVVGGLSCSGRLRRRLLDLGFVEDTEVICVGKSPHGDPKAYKVRGAVIAIRMRDGRCISLKERKHEADCRI